jgi:pSer/pThr/pTyr-binding forkhead associated (FHA) protein
MDELPFPACAPDLVPLRLLLQPGELIIQLTRPDMVLGRHSEADVRLPLPDVSRKHCRFLHVQGLWHVVDLNSLNGVYVNDQPVQRAVLHQGDRLRIGGVSFLVDLTGQAHSAADAEASLSLADSLFKGRPRTLAFPEPRRKAS